MTKFDDIMSMINRNKNKGHKKGSVDSTKPIENDNKLQDDNSILEVSGSETTRAPIISSADENTDPGIIDMLYTKPGWRNIPNRGENASSWDDTNY